MKNKTWAFTGPRPQNLPWGNNESDPRCLEVKKLIKEKIIDAIDKGYEIFITGLALGCDIYCAEIIFELKKTYPQIRLIGAIPCKTQDKFWDENSKKRYKNIISKIDDIHCLYDNYIGRKCMIERNYYMVKNSSLLIAIFSGVGNGTKSTIEYAKKLKVNIEIINF